MSWPSRHKLLDVAGPALQGLPNLSFVSAPIIDAGNATLVPGHVV
jgi:hypothetical protein